MTVPGSMKLGASVGIPIPRLTYICDGAKSQPCSPSFSDAESKSTYTLLELLSGALGDPLPPCLASILDDGALLLAGLGLLLAKDLDLDTLLGV